MSWISLVLGWVATAAGSGASAGAGDVFALEHVRIAGTTEEVTILIRAGRIAEIGTAVAIPPEAERIDGLGTNALPGFIDAFSDLGLPSGEKAPPPSSPNEGVAQDTGADAFAETAEASRRGLFPERRARLLLAPFEKDASEKLRLGGFTDVLSAPADGFLAGQACLVDLSDLPVRDAAVTEPGWLHMKLRSGTRDGGYPSTTMGALAHLRQAFLDAQRLMGWRESYRRDPAAVARPPSDDCLDALIRVLDHKLKIAFSADHDGDIRRALALAQEFHFELVVVGAKEGFKCAKELAAARVPVVASLNFPDAPERKGAKLKKPDAKAAAPDAKPAAAVDPNAVTEPAKPVDPAAPEEWEIADPVLAEDGELFRERRSKWEDEVRNVERLLAAGVSVSLTTRGSSSVADFLADLRTAIEKGLAADAALRALTATPAELFGVTQELGALRPGLAANLSLVEGDLQQKERAVRHVFVAGRHFEGAKKKDEKPADAAAKTGDAATALDLSGAWTLKQGAPGGSVAHGGAFQSKLTLKQEGTVLSGRLVSEMGEAEISSGSLDVPTSKIVPTFKIVIVAQFQNQKFEFVLKGTATQELLSGTMDTPFGEPVEFEARRTPKAASRVEDRR